MAQGRRVCSQPLVWEAKLHFITYILHWVKAATFYEAAIEA